MGSLSTESVLTGITRDTSRGSVAAFLLNKSINPTLPDPWCYMEY